MAEPAPDESLHTPGSFDPIFGTWREDGTTGAMFPLPVGAGDSSREGSEEKHVRPLLPPGVPSTCPGCGTSLTEADDEEPLRFCFSCGASFETAPPAESDSGDTKGERDWLVIGVAPHARSTFSTRLGWFIVLVQLLFALGSLALTWTAVFPLGNLPWPWFHPTLALYGGIGFALGAVLALVWIRRSWLASQGCVKIRADGIAFEKATGGSFVPWDEVTGYSAKSPRAVQLVRRGTAIASPSLAIPTLDEAARVAVLGALDRRQVPQVDA
jgi:hypothetical protein